MDAAKIIVNLSYYASLDWFQVFMLLCSMCRADVVVAAVGCCDYQSCELMLDKVVELLQKGTTPSLACSHRVIICYSRRVEKRIKREATELEQHKT